MLGIILMPGTLIQVPTRLTHRQGVSLGSPASSRQARFDGPGGTLTANLLEVRIHLGEPKLVWALAAPEK
jgi:hypothetical protein